MSNGQGAFESLFVIMLNQAAKFGPVVVLGLLRRSNSLDFENGPTEVRNDDPTVRTFFYY